VLGPFIELFEVVARVERRNMWLVPKPLEVFKNSVNVCRVFGIGVCVVESKVADSVKFVGQFEIEGDGFCVSDMEIAVWLWREACLESPPESVVGEIVSDEFSNKVV